MSLDTRFVTLVPLQQYFVDKTLGTPLAAGVVTFYEDAARTIKKSVYTLSGSPPYSASSYVELPNPLILSNVGTFQDENGADIIPYLFPYEGSPSTSNNVVQLYYITVYSSGGVLQFTREAWPNLASSSSATGVYTYNFVRNPTFFSWSNGTLFSNVKTGSVSDIDFFVDDFAYTQNDATQTINLSRASFSAGDTLVPGNPPYYFVYENTTGGTTGSTNNLFQNSKSVQTLSGQNVAFSISLNRISGSDAPITVRFLQYFGGGGGSANVFTTLLTISSTGTQNQWATYTGTVLIPSIAGKTIGSTGDDCIKILIDMPLNLVTKIGIANIKLEQGTEITGTQEFSNDDIQRETNAYTLYPPFTTGDVKATFKITADVGWLLMDDASIGNPTSVATHKGWGLFALFSLLWTNVSDTYAPVSGGRGVSAKADWDANKNLTLCKVLGRALAGAGTGAGLTARALGQNFGTESENITLTTNELPAHVHDADGPTSGYTFTVHKAGGAGSDNYQTTGTPPADIAYEASTKSAGLGNPFTISHMQPSSFMNVMIKL